MTSAFRRSLVVSLAACAGMALAAIAPGAVRAQSSATRYRNIVNNRFATISSGPQSALIVDVPSTTTRAASDNQVDVAVRSVWRAMASGGQQQLTRMVRSGVLKPRGIFPLSTVVIERRDGRLVLPGSDTTRAVGATLGNGELTFQFSGFTTSDQAYLQNFVNTVYPIIKNIYGAPATTSTVTILNAGDQDVGELKDVQRLAYGYYDVSTNTIHLPHFDASPGSNLDSMSAALLLNLIHAFHGPAVLQYDAWEQGFARAAASVVLRSPIVQSFLLNNHITFLGSDPTSNNLLSFLSYYDLLNQPPLGNSTFFPPSQANLPLNAQLTFAKMFYARLAMSGAVWLKVYIENQNFFQQFNAAYYAQASGNPTIAGNVPALIGLAGSALPNGVEGQAPFSAWVSQQYILDTSITPGNKLYALVLPGTLDTSNGQDSLVTVVYYKTTSTGDETLLDGQCDATYLDDVNAVNHLGSDQDSQQIISGEGFFTLQENPTPGFDNRRITMTFTVGDATARSYLPEGFSGDFQGVILGPGLASVPMTVQETTIPPIQTRSASTTAHRAAFGVNLGMQVNDLAKTVVTVNNGSTATTFQVNTGDGFYYAVLRAGVSGGSVTTAAHTFSKLNPNLPQLVSFPVQPLSSSPDTALGLGSGDFLLNAWDATSSGFITWVAGSASFPHLEAGRGYWLTVAPASGATSATVQIRGNAVPTDSDYAVAAPYGWSLIGSPFGTDIDVNNIRVQLPLQDPMSWQDAVSAQFVQADLFDFDPVAGVQSQTAIQGSQWKGYWVRIYYPAGATLLLPGPDAPARAVTRAATNRAAIRRAAVVIPASRPTADWRIHVTAHQETGGAPFTGTASATLGGAHGLAAGFDSRLDREEPPAAFAGVRAEFFRSDWNAGRSSGGRFVADFRDSAAVARGTTWDLRVTTPADGPATLTWDGVGTAPRRTRLTLVDTSAGNRVVLRSGSSYTWTGEAGKSRAFQVIAAPERSLPLALTNITVAHTRAANAAAVSIGYSVLGDSDATVEVTVSALNGRVMRHLADSAASGTTRSINGSIQRTIAWDGRSDDGAPLPIGTYLLKFTAHGADGSTVREQRPVLMTR